MQTFRLAVVLCSLLILATSSARCDETHARYFEQLRQRGLFSLAESEALAKLAEDDVSIAGKTSFSIELSRTLAEHAGFVSDEQRNELWHRARTVIQEMLDRDRSNPRSILLTAQLASVYVSEADWLRAEREVRPFDESLRDQAHVAASKAIEQLKAVEKTLADSGRDAGSKKLANGAPLGYELRALLHQVRWQLGLTYRNRAELAAVSSEDRLKDLMDAEQIVRRLIGAADEPIQTRAKLLLAVCSRLKNDRERNAELLTALEKMEPKPIDSVQDEITAERVRFFMEQKRPTEAAELLLKTRSRRQRLTGELWMLQTRTLIALRSIALEKQQETLAERLAEQVIATIDRCEEQVGGFWGRRCRQFWDNSRTAEKYGADLDALMQQARADFTAGRIETALAEYATAEKTANGRSQPDLAMELGFTRASILLDETQFEAASTEFLRLAAEYATQARAPKAHLLAAYCLGRLYDDKRTQLRREAYTEALDRHLKDYPFDATVNDARYLKAQFEEQRLQATLALPLYLRVDSIHSRALDAMAGAARCSETILRRMTEKHLSTEEFEKEAINRLTTFLSEKTVSNEHWTVTHADIALRLASILMMNTSDRSSSDILDRSREKQAANSPDSRNSNRFQLAEQWLVRVKGFIEGKDVDAVPKEEVDRLRQRLIPLRIVALAGNGNFAEAEKISKSQSVSPPEILNILERLTSFVNVANDGKRTQIALLQLRLAEHLNAVRDQLSPADCAKLDRCVMDAYLSSGQVAPAVTIARKLAEQTAKDVEKQRELAMLLADVPQPEAQSLAKQCWRRIESLTKAGSAEWLTARLGVLNTCIRLNQVDEGQKLLQVTKVLYPDLGREPFKSQFASTEKELQTKKRSAP